MNRPTVWAIKEQVRRDGNGQTVPIDYSPVNRYGDLRFITDFDPPLHPSSTLMAGWLKAIEAFLCEATTEDYVVLTGAPLATFLVGMICGWSGKIPKVLVWRRERNAYEVFDSRNRLEDFLKEIAAQQVV